MLPFKIFAAFVLILVSWQLFKSLRTMEMRMRGGGIVYRHERPKLFWSMVGIGCWGIFWLLAIIFFFPN